MSEPGKYDKDYIVVLVCDNIPNQKFWDAKIKNWTSDLEMATVYSTYGQSARTIWNNIPENKVLARITSCNKTLYHLMLTGQWDGYGKLPEGY